MKALITGGAGFIGSHLLERLVLLNNEVTILDNLSSGLKENLSQCLRNKNVQFIPGDCTRPSDVKGALKDVDIVFHLAANPEVRLELNFTGGIDGGRGWVGDVKNMLLDVRKLKSMGWKPRYSSGEAVRKTVKSLLC